MPSSRWWETIWAAFSLLSLEGRHGAGGAGGGTLAVGGSSHLPLGGQTGMPCLSPHLPLPAPIP